MISNPTGAESAQVQDDAEKLVTTILAMVHSMPAARDITYAEAKAASDEIVAVASKALREAEQRGMMRARDIAMAIDSGRGNEAEIARAIERAAKEGK